MEDPAGFPDHKLSGYLIALLDVSIPVVCTGVLTDPAPASKTLVPGTRCQLFSDASTAGFRTDCGVVLLPIPDVAPAEQDASTRNSKAKRRRGVVLVRGSRSIVNQLQVLVSSRCAKVESRVLRICQRGGEERAAVLIDVFLPVVVWSGWQFPYHSAVAVAVFKHVSCNWEARCSLLALDRNSHELFKDYESVWAHPSCHVFGCEVHSTISNDEKFFDLHEIFRSLPCLDREEKNLNITKIKPKDTSAIRGIWDITDDLLRNVLTQLGPKDLIRVSAVCHHLRWLASSIMPFMKLKLFPHQEAAVEWMINREHNAKVLPHPLYKEFFTEDGLLFCINVVDGNISAGMMPTVNDFRGGMFCDEPGLGKTITALSLILKTRGTLADPPKGVDVTWCEHQHGERFGYYEASVSSLSAGNYAIASMRFCRNEMQEKNVSASNPQPPLEFSSDEWLKSPTRKRGRSVTPILSTPEPLPTNDEKVVSSSHGKLIRRNLEGKFSRGRNANEVQLASCLRKNKEREEDNSDSDETWVQCDACKKWRKQLDSNIVDATKAWFCSMNRDPHYNKCASPEESWDLKAKTTYLPGFYTKGTSPGKEQNVTFFTNVMKVHFYTVDVEAKQALIWLSNLSAKKLIEMETVGVSDSRALPVKETVGYCKLFQAFGLVRRVERGLCRWYYPPLLDNLAFDLPALKIALTKPINYLRFYLSKATLVVVPNNLVSHWCTQILKHVSPGQLRVYVWGDHKPSTHSLAWDYDIVITTFRRLSSEWVLGSGSTLMQIHWLRVILDEGHTLGSSLSLTNKLKLAVSLTASNRWILTGTPMPNTPTSQVSHLYPLLKFLHEEAYGESQEGFVSGIQKPFEAHMEEGWFRLQQLLSRIMISARKADLRSIPPCIRKVTFVHFNEQHAYSYNELVTTVRRNILMADWNDPSHVESLLNPKQWKFRSTTIRNLRLSCCVAGHIKMRDAGDDIEETMDMLEQKGLDPLAEEYTFIRLSLLNGCSCQRCNSWCRLPVVTPCKHLLCLDCVALDSEKCTFSGCSYHYEMQSPEASPRPENPNPKWPVPKDLIELQPSYEQNDWAPDWQSTSSSKVAYLVEKLHNLWEINKKNGFGVVANGIVTRPGMHSLQEIAPTLNASAFPEKVIVFCQFLEHINVIEQQLTGTGIAFTGLYSPMHLANKIKSLEIFQEDPNCMTLLMDGSTALGLDLSFVTHVFLMEPIWDRSMEEQVISRAHRMGATHPIYVETLAMHGTIEEQMLALLQDTKACGRMVNQELSSVNCEGTRAFRTFHDFAEKSYLAKLTYVRTRPSN